MTGDHSGNLSCHARRMPNEEMAAPKCGRMTWSAAIVIDSLSRTQDNMVIRQAKGESFSNDEVLIIASFEHLPVLAVYLRTRSDLTSVDNDL